MQIDSRSLDDLNRQTRHLSNLFLEACEKEGLRVKIYSTFRNGEAQQFLYDKGRKTPGGRVTNAKPGFSWHNFRCAFDAVPIGKNGKAVWTNTEAFRKMGRIGKSVGLEWGGDWKSFPDMPHFQYTGGRTIGQLRALYGKEAPILT